MHSGGSATTRGLLELPCASIAACAVGLVGWARSLRTWAAEASGTWHRATSQLSAAGPAPSLWTPTLGPTSLLVQPDTPLTPRSRLPCPLNTHQSRKLDPWPGTCAQLTTCSRGSQPRLRSSGPELHTWSRQPDRLPGARCVRGPQGLLRRAGCTPTPAERTWPSCWGAGQRQSLALLHTQGFYWGQGHTHTGRHRPNQSGTPPRRGS